MDSMPAAASFGLPTLDALKVSEPETKTQHVEDTTTTQNFVSAFIERHLPRGVSETEIEIEKKWFIGSIDCGTTSSRFLIFDGTGTPAASHQIEFENIYPDSG
jgi:glycerol kinase